MPASRLAEMTWEELRDAVDSGAVAILPIGAVEAHGPHLPLSTDVVIAEGMARACAESLNDAGRTAFVLPPIWYTAAPFASAFNGTISVEADTVRELVLQIARSLGGQGITTMAIANAHFDPAHVMALRAAAAEPPEGVRIVFLDATRRRVAEQLTEEFQTGACHAGRYEGSMVRAEAPELYREEIAEGLEPNPASLSEAIQAGLSTFDEAGGPRAYFGWPAEATAEEGRETIQTLGRLLSEAILADGGA